MPLSPSEDTHSDLASHFAHLAQPLHSECLRYAERMLGERADAEDAIQDAWLRGLRAFRRYDSTRPFRPWMFRIVVNSVRSHLRQRSHWWQRWTQSVDPDSMAADARSPASQGRHEALRAAVAALPNALREAFLLKYVSEMSYQEIASATGATIPALKMRVKRACDVLRPQLTGAVDDDDDIGDGDAD